MGKPRDSSSCPYRQQQQQQHLVKVEMQLPPPPPLQPRPDLLTPATGATTVLYDEPASAAAASEVEGLEGPLDYSMKRLREAAPRSPSPVSASASLASSSSSPASIGCDYVLHRLRHTVLQRHPKTADLQVSLGSERHQKAVALALKQCQQFSSLQQQGPKQPTNEATATAVSFDSATESRAVYAADCIKSRLEGCGKRVHLFLGILLHFGMPPGPEGERIFEQVIAFSDEHKNLRSDPTPYFMVLDSKLLALIWCKFKGNTSSEYSTLTRAIRSTRQKYKGIFEAVENPGKKLYKFGPVALDQFRNLFPRSYASPQLESGTAD